MSEIDSNAFFPAVSEQLELADLTTKKYIYCYPILRKCLENVIQKKSVIDPLIDMGIYYIGLYAVNEFMDYMLNDENAHKLRDIRLYDRDVMRFSGGYHGKDVNGIERMLKDYSNRNIEKIVVCNLTHGNEIALDFIKYGIASEDIFVIDSLIYSI